MGLAALVTTALALVGVQPALAGKSHPGFYGVYFQPQGKTEKDVRKMGGNVKHVKMALRWPTVESREGEFHWEGYDNVIGDMASRGIQVLPQLYGSPRWAENNGGKPPLSSNKSRQGWKAFVTQAVDRYGPNGTYWTDPLGFVKDHPGKSPQPIQAWQVWNEPNLQHYFKADNKVGAYADLLSMTHDAIKQADSNAKVVLAGLVGNGKPSGSMNAWTFLNKLYKKGAKGKFDVAALHPYAVDIRYQTKWVRKFHRIMSQHGDGKKPLWITEVSWGSAHPDQYGFNVGPKGQKRMLTKSFEKFYRERHKFSIRRAYWFTFRDPKHGNARCSFCGSAGLLKSNFHKKPAWTAFKSFAAG
jgi:hypothetical protein